MTMPTFLPTIQVCGRHAPPRTVVFTGPGLGRGSVGRLFACAGKEYYMNSRMLFQNHLSSVSTPLFVAWTARGLNHALAACLGMSMCLAVSAQDFYNLDFEEARLIPVPGDAYGRVQYAPALPGWAGFCGTDPQTLANYNNEFLDTAGISILDTNCSTNTFAPVPPGFIHGRYCALIQGGHYGSGMPIGPAVDTFIAQSGTVPPDAKSILFNTSYLTSEERLVVTFNSTAIPLAGLSVVSDQMVLGGDVSPFAGQTGELRFTSPVIWYT